VLLRLGALYPNFSGQLARAPFLEAHPSMVVFPMLNMWSYVLGIPKVMRCQKCQKGV
jgi:hypothetical protein